MNTSFLERPEVKSLLGSAAKTGFAMAEQWLNRQRVNASARTTAFAESAKRAQADAQREMSRMAANASATAQSVTLPAIVQPSEEEKFPTSLVAGLVIGGLAGAVTALLMTPQSGKATQRQIKQEAQKWQTKVSDYADTVSAKTSVNVSDLKDRAVDAANNAAEKFNSIRS